MTASRIKIYRRNILIYILIIVFIFLGRILLFAGTFGGVEHDSGWYLGVARNLAQRGIYASYTNTITESSPGAHPSLHGRFSVQDKDGFSYFPAGVTVGPGYIIPQALLLKIFGFDFWQYRLWPLLAFTGLLFILFLLVYRLGGIISLIIFQLWLWIVPQLYTAYAYEAYSEHIALFYLLLSFIFYYFSVTKSKFTYLIFAGLFFSFSVLTKNLFLLAGVSFALSPFYELIARKYKLKTILARWSIFVISFLCPLILFEAYRFISLTSRFGYSGWAAINKDIEIVFRSAGSGIDNFSFSTLNWNFVLQKAMIWTDIGIKENFVVWILFFITPLFILRFLNAKGRLLFFLLFLSSTVSFAWFIFVSPTGWARHIWQGLVIGMMLLSICIGISFKKFLIKKNVERLFFAFLLSIFVLSLIRYDMINPEAILSQKTIERWRMNRYVRGLEGLPSTPILSLSDQKELISFFRNKIKEKDKVYYLGWFIMAEASPLVDKVFYSLNRYFYLNQQNPDGGASYAIMGPYQQGPWSLEPPTYVPDKVSELCKTVVFKNPSYLVCVLKTGLLYNNPAY